MITKPCAQDPRNEVYGTLASYNFGGLGEGSPGEGGGLWEGGQGRGGHGQGVEGRGVPGLEGPEVSQNWAKVGRTGRTLASTPESAKVGQTGAKLLSTPESGQSRPCWAKD